MEEYLHPKEQAVLDCLRSHYHENLRVCVSISIEDFDNLGIATMAQGWEVLKALMIRGYIDFNLPKDIKKVPIFFWKINLKEKALNYFNK